MRPDRRRSCEKVKGRQPSGAPGVELVGFIGFIGSAGGGDAGECFAAVVAWLGVVIGPLGSGECVGEGGAGHGVGGVHGGGWVVVNNKIKTHVS